MKTILYLIPFFSFGAYAQQPSAILNYALIDNNWQLTGGRDFFYNINEQVTDEINKYFYAPNTWENDWKYSKNYNSNDQVTNAYMIQFNGSEWSDTTGGVAYEYNFFGQMISENWYTHQSSPSDNQRVLYTYFGASDDVHTKIYQNFNETTNEWENSYKSVLSYSDDQTIEVNYVNDSSNWVLESRTVQTLNPGHKPITEVQEAYIDNQWIEARKIDFTYTNFGEISTRISSFLSLGLNEWVLADSMYWSYNPDQTIDYHSISSFDIGENDWTYHMRNKYVYDSQLTLNEEEKEVLSVYPNPATEKITINTSETGILSLTDAQGNTLRTITESGNVDISDLAHGTYFIRLQTKNGFTVKPFVKQ